VSSLGDHATSMVISSTILGLMEMLILIMGEILAMFPSSKEFWVGIGLWNYSIFPKEIKSLVLIAHMDVCIGGSKAYCEIKITH